MAFEFRLPDLGEGLTEGEVARWLVAEGDDVAEDDPLVEIATDKTTVEIPSPAAGVVSRILVGEGEVVPVGTVLVVIGGNGAASPPPGAGARLPPAQRRLDERVQPRTRRGARGALRDPRRRRRVAPEKAARAGRPARRAARGRARVRRPDRDRRERRRRPAVVLALARRAPVLGPLRRRARHGREHRHDLDDHGARLAARRVLLSAQRGNSSAIQQSPS